MAIPLVSYAICFLVLSWTRNDVNDEHMVKGLTACVSLWFLCSGNACGFSPAYI